MACNVYRALGCGLTQGYIGIQTAVEARSFALQMLVTAKHFKHFGAASRIFT